MSTLAGQTTSPNQTSPPDQTTSPNQTTSSEQTTSSGKMPQWQGWFIVGLWILFFVLLGGYLIWCKIWNCD